MPFQAAALAVKRVILWGPKGRDCEVKSSPRTREMKGQVCFPDFVLTGRGSDGRRVRETGGRAT